MENNEGKITFSDVLDDAGSPWELLDDESSTFMPDGFGVPTTPPTPTPAPKDTTEEPEVDPTPAPDTTFEDELEETPEVVDEPEETEDDEEDDIFSYIGNTLGEKGILTVSEDTKFESGDDIWNAVQSKIDSEVQAYKDSLGEDSRKYIEYLEAGGDPSRYIAVNAQSDFSTLDISDKENAKRVLSEFYKAKGFSEAKITKLIETSEDLEELEIDAKDAQEFFTQKKEADKQALIEQEARALEARRKQEEQFTQNLEDFVQKQEAVRNFPLKTKQQKQEILDYMFKKTVPFEQNGQTVKISQYMADKIKRNQDEAAKTEDLIFDALIMKYGSDPIQKKAITDRNRKLADLGKRHRSNSTSTKLSGSGGKSKKPRGGSHSFDDLDWETLN